RTYMERAERLSEDPLQQLLIFVGLFEESLAELTTSNAGCLFASYAYEAGLFDEATLSLIRRSVERWRERVREKLDEVVSRYSPRVEVDLDSLADLLWVIFEGGFILSRTTGDPAEVSIQLRQYRTYLRALFSV
ncbi:MAG TPA: TetR family transcriptional regulator C-terminal domain-containing protein, partial [Longimicrobiales bacterium]|nr:TetR family transcriptional regulator C-terminal domain-containing protein [Longimicrobiales bacterium]